MAIDEFTVSQNTGYVEMANGGMSSGQIDDIERRAKAQVVSAEGETSRADTAEKSAKAGPEASVYGGLAMEAALPGMKILSTVAEFLDERRSDVAAQGFTPAPQAGRTDGITQGRSRTMEQDISGAMRAPGLYREPAQPGVYNAGAFSSGGKSGKKVSGEEVFMSASIAQSSLREQPTALFSAMEVKNPKLASVGQAKQLTFGLKLSNEKALESTLAARREHAAVMYQVNQLSPGLGMANGPSIRPDQLLREAREDNDERWRSGN